MQRRSVQNKYEITSIDKPIQKCGSSTNVVLSSPDLTDSTDPPFVCTVPLATSGTEPAAPSSSSDYQALSYNRTEVKVQVNDHFGKRDGFFDIRRSSCYTSNVAVSVNISDTIAADAISNSEYTELVRISKTMFS